MKFPSLLTNLTAAVFLLGSGMAFACDSMGPNVHAGTISAIDAKTQTFTIIDAETSKPITFKASKEIMLQLAAHNSDPVIVGYAKEGGTLIAANVK
jgi:hypothetical protein